jgi:hypothetical protein
VFPTEFLFVGDDVKHHTAVGSSKRRTAGDDRRTIILSRNKEEVVVVDLHTYYCIPRISDVVCH